jgi:deoxyribodipyrimidine photo-lyase
MKTAIWWIRRDLRLSDSQALAEALAEAGCVIPIFILDPVLLESARAGEGRLAFLFDGLRALDIQLRSKGSTLIIRQGDPVGELLALFQQTGAEGIYAEEDFSPFARKRDERVRRDLPLNLLPGLTVHPCDMFRKSDGIPYTVFTPFSRMWRSLPGPGKPFTAPASLPSVPPLARLEIPNSTNHSARVLFPAGENAAQQRLSAFTENAISRYAEERNRLDLDGTSGLSPYLRFGMISARQAAWSALQAEAHADTPAGRQGAQTWLIELIWRDFYFSVLNYFPRVHRKAFRQGMDRIPWRDDVSGFYAWCAGLTGYPVVDAGMRQLNATGWMHNRARMITASFLTKDLLIDWRKGEGYFMQHLIDADPAANNGGWQWTAGTGTDAAPYFRVFNPVLQGRKFDPHGANVRRWVPELASVPDVYIHAPWEMPVEIQRQAGCLIGRDYPAPIVDHSLARQRALDAYRSSRS